MWSLACIDSTRFSNELLWNIQNLQYYNIMQEQLINSLRT